MSTVENDDADAVFVGVMAFKSGIFVALTDSLACCLIALILLIAYGVCLLLIRDPARAS